MFVLDSSNLLMAMNLEVISAEGQKWEAQLDPNVTIAELKQMAYEKFYTTTKIDVGWDAFRVVFPAEYRTLTDTHAIHEETLKDRDILVLIRRRSLVEETLAMDAELKAPTLEEISAATASLPIMTSSQVTETQPSTSEPNVDNYWSEDDFQLELRKIIISLITVMSTLLRGNPDADAICKDMHAKVKNRLSHCKNKAIEGTTVIYPPPPEIEMSPMGIVVGLIELKKREFRPNQAALESCRALGFSDIEIVEALRVCKNSKLKAVEWLTISSKPRTNPEDCLNGLDPNSRLLNSLVTNPMIRLGLNNPKLLLAFLGIIESAASAHLWLSDPDSAPVLSGIFKMYHADKHLA